MEAYDPLGFLWLFAVAGGALLLGLAIWWGARNARNRSRPQDAVGEARTRSLYHEGGPPKMDD